MTEGRKEQRLQRPAVRELMAEVLGGLEELPASLAERLDSLIEATEDRAVAIRELFEELSRD